MTGLKQPATPREPALEGVPHADRHPVRAPHSRWQVNGVEQRLLKLTRTIEVEIIPRLLLANGGLPRAEQGGLVPAPADVAELADLLLTRDGATAFSFVDGLRLRGARVETLYLDLLAPAARHLGDLWCDDICSFSDVTVGLVRLQQVLRELSPSFHDEVAPRQLNRRALLVPTPGEQHTFGLNMVAEFFRRAGWDVWTMATASEDKLARIVRRKWFALVGLSLGSESKLERLSSGIRSVRRASRNRSIGVMVGGPIFVAQPDLVALVGADATASDGQEATRQAERMLDLLTVNG
jgi:methanogenic corrinoid protein MtbC1